MKSSVKKHSIVLGALKTSISLEDEFWGSLKDIARRRGKTLTDLLVKINADREYANLSSAIRLFVLQHYRQQLDQQGGVLATTFPISCSATAPALATSASIRSSTSPTPAGGMSAHHPRPTKL
jgi:predicted DNA-binding ribbon-helix-helix protein